MKNINQRINGKLAESIITDDYGPTCNNLISEAGLSRLLTKYNEGKEFAIITAYRRQYGKAENIRRNRDLRAVLNAAKMGVYQLVGHWQECRDPDINWRNCPKDQLVDTIERSYMVIKPDAMDSQSFATFIVGLVDEYEQDGALIKQGPDVEFIQGDGTRFSIGTDITLGKITQAYSQYVKKMNVPFVFEGVETPSNNNGSMLFRECGILYPPLTADELKTAKTWPDLVSMKET